MRNLIKHTITHRKSPDYCYLINIVWFCSVLFPLLYANLIILLKLFYYLWVFLVKQYHMFVISLIINLFPQIFCRLIDSVIMVCFCICRAEFTVLLALCFTCNITVWIDMNECFALPLNVEDYTVCLDNCVITGFSIACHIAACLTGLPCAMYHRWPHIFYITYHLSKPIICLNAFDAVVLKSNHIPLRKYFENVCTKTHHTCMLECCRIPIIKYGQIHRLYCN